jgi:hypothetical protein
MNWFVALDSVLGGTRKEAKARQTLDDDVSTKHLFFFFSW